MMMELNQAVKARGEDWQRLMSDAFVRLWWTGDEVVTVEFDPAAAQLVRERLLELARAERQTSGSLRWQVRGVGPHLRLQVKGPGAADTVAALMY